MTDKKFDSLHIITIITVVLITSVIAMLSTPIVFADVETTEHGGGSGCYNCHVEDFTTGDEAFLHNMTAGDAARSCSNSGCHLKANFNGTGSIHESVTCLGCHSPLHVSFNTDGTGAWLFVNRMDNSTNLPLYVPTLPVTLNQTVYYFNSGNDTTLLGEAISAMGGEIHWAWTNVSGSAVGISSSARYLVCFNCHFLTVNPAEAGLTRMIQGQLMVGIPEFTLKLKPHDITDSVLREAGLEKNQFVVFKPNDVPTISGIIAGIGLIGLVIWRKRG
ncbi:hypothetical protein ACFL96_09820 [Thermoproteota archaeon]